MEQRLRKCNIDYICDIGYATLATLHSMNYGRYIWQKRNAALHWPHLAKAGRRTIYICYIGNATVAILAKYNTSATLQSLGLTNAERRTTFAELQA